MEDEDKTLYEKYLACCGSIIGCCCCTYKHINTSTLGMLEHFGKFKNECTPGLNYYNPLVEKIVPISLKTITVNMPKQSVYTKDNMSVSIDTCLFYRIIDPFRATYIVKDILSSIMQLTFVTLRTVCGEYILQELLIQRQHVASQIEQFVRKEAKEWGIYVEYILLKDMHLSDYLQNNLSLVPKSKRAAETKIISARADLESAKLYREAADILDIKAAMQIRFLQTLELMDKKKSSKTVIIPLNLDYS